MKKGERQRMRNNKFFLILISAILIVIMSFLVIASPPTHNNPILNSTYGTNYSNENLTCYNQSTSDPLNLTVQNIYNWYKNGTSLMIINLPFAGLNNTNSSKDYSGNNFNGTPTGATWNATAGYDGFGAYEFDGINDSMITPLGNFSPDKFTISFWMYPNEVGSSGTGNGTSTLVVTNGNNFGNHNWFFEYWDDGDFNFISCTPNCTGAGYNINNPNQWYYITGVYDGTNFNLYVNGDLKNSVAGSKYSNNKPLLFGTGFCGSGTGCDGGYFNGTLDDITMYNVVLSSEQINALYNNKTNQIVSSQTIRDETYSCSITPNNGYEDGIEKFSNNLTILNSKPEVTPYYPSNNSYLPELNKKLFWTFYDADGDNQAKYNIIIDNDSDFSSPLINITNPSSDNFYDASTLEAGKTYYWKSRAQEDYTEGLWSLITNAWKFIVNYAPTQDNPLLNLTYGNNGTTIGNLTCYNQSTSDTDPVYNVYNWYKNGNKYDIINIPFEAHSNFAYYHDYANNNYPVTFLGNPNWNSTGGYNNTGAYHFNGGEYLLIDNDDMPIEDHTYELMVNFDVLDNTTTQIYLDFDGEVGTYLGAHPLGKSGQICLVDTVTFGTICSPVVTNTSKWYHIALVVYPNSTGYFYMDGNLAGSGVMNSINISQFTLGAWRVNPSSNEFKGYLDNFRVYDGTLSPNQISLLANGESDKIISNELSLTQVWRCDIIPNDGIEDGVIKQSNFETIAFPPSPPVNENFTAGIVVFAIAGIVVFATFIGLIILGIIGKLVIDFFKKAPSERNLKLLKTQTLILITVMVILLVGLAIVTQIAETIAVL